MPSRRNFSAGIATTAVLARSSAFSAQPVLKGPVDVARRRELIGTVGQPASCPVIAEPQRDIELNSFYMDPASSVVDPDRLKRYQVATQIFGSFSINVARQADLWVGSKPPQPAAAVCTLNWLNQWASARAMLGQVGAPNGEHQRKWALAGAVLAYLKVRDAPGLDPAAKRRVEQWFAELAIASNNYYSKWRRSSYNNHLYWLGLALTATAVANDDSAMLQTGFGYYRAGLEDIQPDGTLPLEMARKGRALTYHVFSLMPLVMIAEIGQANGIDLYAERGGSLHHLAQRVQAGLADPAWFVERAGPQQEVERNPRNLSWAEPYYARFPNLPLGQMISAVRPIFYHWLGGNLTHDFGSPALARL